MSKANLPPSTLALVRRFPKTPPPIDPELVEILYREYKKNREGTSFFRRLCQGLESWMHRRIAKEGPASSILEIGAGTLNHLSYESNFKNYDVIEPYEHWYEGKREMQCVRNTFSDISDIASSEKYERIISIATLEHVLDLPKLIAHSCRLVREDGVFQAAIPSEGGFLWGLSWRLSTGLLFRLRTGYDYGQLMRHEHVNTACEIIELINVFFEDVHVERFPFNHEHLSFYSYIVAKNPRRKLAREFLSSEMSCVV